MGRKFLEAIKIYLKNSCPVLFLAPAIAFFLFLPCSFSSEFLNEEPVKDKESAWMPYSAGPITTWTAPLCGRARFVVQPFFFYNRARGLFNSEGSYKSFQNGDRKYEYQQQLFFQYGVTEKFEIDAQALYQEHFIKQSGQKVSSSGLGDSFLFLRYCPIEENGFLPTINGLMQIKFPTGKFQNLNPDKLGADLMGAATGAGSFDHGYGVIFTKKLKPFILHSDFIYTFPIERKINSVKTRYARYLNCDFALEYFFTGNINLIFEVNNILQGDRKENGDFVPNSNRNQTMISPGIGWSSSKIQTLLAYQRVLTGENADANDSVVFTFVYAF
ncbi:MAG: transporter [Candidatus Omnitrophica bacterium]|nr:transporter [Candidatus Omnitrophota bacterium]